MCSVTKGDTPIKIWWTFKGENDDFPYNLTTSDGIVITRSSQKISMLAIEAVKARHRGNYTCFAHNKAGVSQQSSYLHINGLTYFFVELLTLAPKFEYEFCNLCHQKFQFLFQSKIIFLSSSTNRSIHIRRR